MVQKFDSNEFSSIHERFKRFTLAILSCTALFIGIHQCHIWKMNRILGQVYGRYAGSVLDIYPRRVMTDFTRMKDLRVGQMVSPIHRLILLEGNDGDFSSVVDHHPAFVCSETPVAVRKGQELVREIASDKSYKIPMKTNSMDTVCCLFGLSKTNFKSLDVVREMCRVCTPRYPQIHGSQLYNNPQKIEGRIILLDWALVPQQWVQSIQCFILKGPHSQIKDFPHLSTLVREAGCVVLREQKFFFGSISLVIAAPENSPTSDR